MRTILAKLAFIASLLLVSAQTFAGDLFVISHPGTFLSANDIRDVFLGEKQFSGSVKLVPIDNAAQQENFLSKFIQINNAKYNSHWSKKAFRDGLAAPAVKSSDAEVVEYVRRTPGGVGYVSSPPATGVNIVK